MTRKDKRRMKRQEQEQGRVIYPRFGDEPTDEEQLEQIGRLPADLRAKELERFKELLDGQARGLDRIRAWLDHEPPSPFRNVYEGMWRDMTEANQQLRRRHDELTQEEADR
jgi:hypothetical protein